MKRIDSLLIGTDISSTSGISVNVNGVSDTGATGEIVVLDKNKQLLVAGKTITDSDVIYIGRINRTVSYTDVNGLTRYPIHYSAPIQGSRVRSYHGSDYIAPSAKVATFSATGFTPVVGTEYILRLVYKDFQSETPAQYIHEYRAFATTTSVQDLYTLLRTEISKDVASMYSAGARITGSGTTTLILTGIAIPFVVGNIDSYKIVDFEAFLNYADPSSQLPYTAGATVVYTGGFPGYGAWQEVHDMEKAAMAYEGITNYTWFPVPSRVNTYTVDSTKTYSLVTIEHDQTYASPDNNYDKQTKLTTVIALPTSCGQGTSLIDVLNPWMASTPKAFPAVTI